MFEVLTSEQAKQADSVAIDNGISSFQLMQTGGRGIADQIINHTDMTPVLILCGPGNNGGDGFIAAKHLIDAGWNVRVAGLLPIKQLKGDAARAAKQWNGNIEELNSNLSLKDTGLIIDAVFGNGFSGALKPELITLFDKIRAKKLPVIAVDLPSGINTATSTATDGTLHANLTITFCRKKTSHLLYPTKIFCGKVHVLNIGIPDQVFTDLHIAVFKNTPALWLKDYPLPDYESHKYTRGHAVIYGGKTRTGAACLAAHAAQKAGAGAVTITSSHESLSTYKTYRASLMVDLWESTEDFKSTLRDERKNVFLLGPGAGTDLATKAHIETALSFQRPCVLDADIFTLYQNNREDLFEKLKKHHVLTPHEGEFSRIFPDITGNKIERAQKAARQCGAIVLLKGADTIIAAPDGRTIINTNAPATLATAGTGDVLAGIITGLIAQNMPPFMAAAAGCWLHSQAAATYGFGLTPEDIISNLNQILNRLFINT